MTNSQAFSTQETHGSTFAHGSHHTKDEPEVPSNPELDPEALSTQRLKDFFANDNFKSSLPASWGQTSVTSATKNMQAQIQAFDQAFDRKDKPA